MAKVLVENTQEGPITLAVANKEGVVIHTTVPPAMQNPEDRTKLINGAIEMDADLLMAGVKASPVIRSYFADGLLKRVTGKGDMAGKDADKDKE